MNKIPSEVTIAVSKAARKKLNKMSAEQERPVCDIIDEMLSLTESSDSE